VRARFGSWYELFPRSWGGLKGVRKTLPELAELGFDVVYLPPIHPIGHTNRKGRNNALKAKKKDPGSPWAIGDETGGHDAVHPELGTLDDVRELASAAAELGMDVALDFAIQEWLIGEVHEHDRDVIFLAEAFTRRAVMRQLAKLGFTQSYTYFTWKNSRWELSEYVSELAYSGEQEYFRPNFFANTPDILHAYLQHGGRPAFEARLILAATLSPCYGIYSGYENVENVALREGSEEYLGSEKYEVKTRALKGELLALIGQINFIRRDNPA